MNTLSNPNISRYSRDILIENSCSPSANQIFLNEDVIIEDDIDPNNFDYTAVKDVRVVRYLKDLDLFYLKKQEQSIGFTSLISGEVKNGEYVYIEVYFESLFNGSHKILSDKYTVTKRVATIKAEKQKGIWKMLIASIVFYSPQKHKFVQQYLDYLNKEIQMDSMQVVIDSLHQNIQIAKEEEAVPEKLEEKKEKKGLKYELGLKAGIGLPVGKFSNLAKVGLAYGVEGIYYINSFAAMEAGITFNSFKGQSETNAPKKWSSTAYTISVLYFLDIKNINPYVSLGIGVYRVKSVFNTPGAPPLNIQPSEIKEITNNFGFVPKVGNIIAINEKLNFNPSISVNNVFYKGELTDGMSFVSMNFSLNYKFY